MKTNRFEILAGQERISPTSSLSDAPYQSLSEENEQEENCFSSWYESCKESCMRTIVFRDGSTAGSIANLCSATLGAGVLALPFAIANAGIGFGILLLLLAAVSTVLSIDMLVLSCAKAKRNSYEELTVLLFGSLMGNVVEGCILFFCFGCCVAYIVAVGDILEQGVLGPLQYYNIPSFVNRESLMILFWTLVMFPLSLYERINELRFASLFGVSSIGVLVFAVSFHSLRTLAYDDYGEHTIPNNSTSPLEFQDQDEQHHETIHLWPASIVDAIRACPIILFAFNCQVNVPAIFDELSPSLQSPFPTLYRSTHFMTPEVLKMKPITRGAVKNCFILYTVIGCLAYLEFGSLTQDNILKNYCVQITHDPLMIVAFCCITISVVLAFPLNVFPSRITLDIVAKRCVDQLLSSRLFSSSKNSNRDQETPIPNSDVIEARMMEEQPLLFTHNYPEEFQQFDSNTKPQIATSMPTPNPNPSPESSQSKFAIIKHQIKHVCLTLLISGSALLVAIMIPDISIVFGLMGGFASSLIGLIMPAAFYLKLKLATNRKKKFYAWLLIVLGTIIGVLSTVVTIYSMFEVEDKVDVCADVHQ